jgi:Mg2+ and Co2+ transporter CorA
VSEDERTIVSGAADSNVVFWEDFTEQEEQERVEQAGELVLKFVSSPLDLERNRFLSDWVVPTGIKTLRITCSWKIIDRL